MVLSIQLTLIGDKIQRLQFCYHSATWVVYHLTENSENFGQNLKAIIRQYKARNNGQRSDP